MKLNLILVVLLITVFTACSNRVTDLELRIKNAEKIAYTNNFCKRTVQAGDFVFTVFERIIDKEKLPFVFYLEKDGYAFTKTGPSDNPTPIKQMLLKLATCDTNRNVVFIARPCQYTDLKLDVNCNTNSYWTKKRLSKEVINSINSLIMSYHPDKPFSLVGHSGGGALAVLVAAFNNNVKDIVTIAANLELDSFNSYHHVEGSMLGSLNPIDYINKVNHIPQLHLAGGLDKIVPAFIIQKYVDVAKSSNVRMLIVENATHNSGWEKAWESLLPKK